VGWPLALLTGDPELDAWLGSSLWAISGSSESRVRLELAADGVEAVKEIELLGDGYQLRVTASLLDGGRARPFTLLWQGSFGDQSTRYDPAQVNLVYQEEGDFDRLNVTDLEEAVSLPATRYLGVEDQYFLALLRSASPEVPEVGLERFQPADAEALQPIPRAGLPYAAPVDIYVGPKRAEDLTAADPGLSAVIDYGFFSVLARPLLGILLWIQGYVGNFGWSIVLMTALINMALFPLRLKQQLSMLKMQKIQPQMRTLQDRYKKLKPNDPRRQEVQAEMMGLYQKNGVNPLGGCLPLLLQMPIFFAIFQLLQGAIELRQAPWLLWISDLSVYDPYYVLPVLMGVSMMASQRLTPTAMDPAQARMMMFMPLLFMVFMVRAQSGLVLYWLTSQMIGVGQQVLISRYWGPDRGAPAAARSLPAEPPPGLPAPEEEAPLPPVPRKRRRKR
jgi:YidC/Oxa1 family membrane protein insertase